MCVALPVALAIASTAAAVGSAAYTGRAQAQQQKFAAQTAEVNATYADRQARDAQLAGQEEEIAHGRKVAQLRAQQRVGFTSQGIDTSFGTPMELLADTTVMGNEDAARIRANALGQERGYRISAQNDNLQAAGYRSAASAAGISTALSVGGTILAGGAKVGESIGKYGAPSWTGKVGQAIQRAYTPK